MTPGTAAIDGGVRLAWANPDEFDRGRALHLLGSAERARAVRTANAGLRDRFLLGRMLLRDLAAEAAGMRAEEVEVTAVCERCGAEHGRPRAAMAGCPGPAPERRASPRARTWWSRRIAPAGVAVGVDVEPRASAARGRRGPRAARSSSCSAEPPRTAVRRWVRAEAVLKADGRGLRVEPGRIAFVERGGRRRDGVTARVPDSPTVYDLVDRRIEGCLVSLAVARPTSAATDERLVDDRGGRQRGHRRVVQPRLEELAEVVAGARSTRSMKSAVVAVACRCAAVHSRQQRRRTRRRRA